MTREEYLTYLFEAYNQGKISDEAYDQALMNIDEFVEDQKHCQTGAERFDSSPSIRPTGQIKFKGE